jgi:endonuclease III
MTLREKAWSVYERLLTTYGERRRDPPRRENMRELVSTMLSHRTTHANEETAYERMLEAFPTWEAVRDAPETDLAHAFRSAKFPEAKARNVKAALSRIIQERGEADIDFLADLSPEDGLAWLMALPGVGLKTASLVLLFNFGKPVLPVDTHVHRVSGRVGLIPPKMSAEKAHGALLKLFPKDPDVLYAFHVNTLRHWQRVCVWGTPRCERCPLTDLCDWYKEHRMNGNPNAQ